MDVTYKKHIDTEKNNRVEFLLINYDYIDGNDYLAKLFFEECGFIVEEKIDGLWYSIIRIRLDCSVYELLWHEDTGNEIYCLNQTEGENEMLQRRLKKVLDILNDRIKEKGNIGMIYECLDEYVLNVLKKSGWCNGRKRDITSWIQVLSQEGYMVNDYAQSVLKELGDLQIRTSSDKNHFGVTLHFNPVNAASGEYDRMEIFNAAANEELFPIGECFDWIIFVGPSKKVYLGDWMSLAIAGDTIEDFLNNIFDRQYKLKEIYTNNESWNIRKGYRR